MICLTQNKYEFLGEYLKQTETGQDMFKLET